MEPTPPVTHTPPHNGTDTSRDESSLVDTLIPPTDIIPPIEQDDSFIKDVIKYALIALVIVIPFRMYIAQPFYVSGASMSPTFETGQYLIIDQLHYQFNEPERGDVIVFKYPRDPSKFFIKRVIGLPGEIVEVRGKEIVIKDKEHNERFRLNEPYIAEENFRLDYITTTLGEDEYFVMGDNRKASSDSRVWGPVTRDLISGKAFLRLMPLTNIDVYPGKEEIATTPISN